MRRIAITGNIACGKSLVGQYIRSMGVPVRDADDVAREVLAPGEAVRDRVVEAFGTVALLPGGEIDRAALGREVFGDDAKREKLNGLMHPEILRRLRAWVASQDAATPCAVAIIPLLYEAGDERNWDAVICVAAPEVEQRRRLLARGMSAKDAEARMRAQLPQADKMRRADGVIFNCGSEELLREQTERVMQAILGG